MKKVLVMVALVMVSVIVYAFNDRAEAKQGKKEVTGNNGEVVVMNKEMFLKDVFDYEKILKKCKNTAIFLLFKKKLYFCQMGNTISFRI